VIDPFQIAAANADAVLRRFEEAKNALPEAQAALMQKFTDGSKPMD
jgi:hypothetical protein